MKFDDTILGLYDKSLFEKLDRVFKDKVVHAPVDEAIKEYYKKLNTVKKEIELPFISFWRVTTNLDIWSRYSESHLRRGRVLRHDKESGDQTRLQTLPVILNYNIDIWARERFVLDQMISELVFYLTEEPNLYIPVTDVDCPYIFTMRITGNEDNTDITEFDERQKLYRMTLLVEVPEARLFRERPENVPVGIDIDIRVKDKLDKS